MFIVPVSRHSVTRSRGFDRLFDDAFDRFLVAPPALDDSAPARRPALDVTESDTQYVVMLDVPGVVREDVKVSIDGRRVAVVAEARKAEPAADGAAPAAPADRLVLRERSAASFARSFTLAAEIDQSSSQARLENGVLTLTLTKRSPSAAQLTVN